MSSIVVSASLQGSNSLLWNSSTPDIK